MEDVEKCEACKYFQGFIEVPNGYKDLTREKINCWYFGYLDTLIDPETCKKYEEKEVKP